MEPRHLYEYVIRPTLDYLSSAQPGINSLAARRLLLGTAMAESDLRYLRQLSDGPALGLWQMEPDSHDDIWTHYLFYRPELARAVEAMTARWPRGAFALVGNLFYGCAMARMQYYRSPKALPKADDAAGLAKYHEVLYNTLIGAIGKTKDELEALPRFEEAIKLTKEDKE